MRIRRGNRRTQRKPAPVPLRPPHILHYLTWDRTRAAAVRSRRPFQYVTNQFIERAVSTHLRSNSWVFAAGGSIRLWCLHGNVQNCVLVVTGDQVSISYCCFGNAFSSSQYSKLLFRHPTPHSDNIETCSLEWRPPEHEICRSVLREMLSSGFLFMTSYEGITVALR
jgi:hypothetical protein